MKAKEISAKKSQQIRYYVVLETGEEMISKLKEFAQKIGITGASISGIGTLKDPELGYFDLEKREYLKNVFEGEFELVSLLGNISLFENDTVIHTHAVISDREFRSFAGHLFGGVITGTAEIIIDTLSEHIERKHSAKAKLNLIDF